jgi:large subunit ribosomal protein L30
MAETAKPRPRTARKKAPAKKPAKGAAPGRITVKQVRSGIGHAATYRRTLEALGLRHQRSAELPDNPSIRGMIYKVRHLVEVLPTKES